jgi:DNA-binding MurR/RpiR family transcriptional regulator
MKISCQGKSLGPKSSCHRKEIYLELLNKIQDRYASLSKNQRKVADYLASDGMAASFDSISELSHKIGVSEASLVRFAKQLGYKGYPSLRKELQAEYRRTSGTASRLQSAVTTVREQSFLESMFQHDIELIEETQSSLTEASFTRAVGMIFGAKKIFIIGFRAAFALAYFLYFRFVRLGLDARLITVTGGTSLVEQLAQMRQGDLVIALGFDETPRETRTTINFALKHRVPVLGISHTATSEIARKATLCLLGRRRPHRTQSLAAPMSLLNALAIAVAARNKRKALRVLRRLDIIEEQYLKE